MLNYSTVPNISGIPIIQDYLEKGMPLDRNDFYYELITNDLKGACMSADIQNRRVLFEWVEWLWNEAPTGAWGSVEAYNGWLKVGGTIGRDKEYAAANAETSSL